MTTIDDSLAEARVMDRNGYPYVIHPLTDGVPRVAPELLEEFAEWVAGQAVIENVDLLLAPEAMALPLATAVSLRTRIPFVCVRKREYGLEGETMAYCDTGYSSSCLYINDVRPTDRVVIIDDMLSTGGTAEALLETLGKMGVTPAAVLIFAEKNARAEALEERTGVPVRAMRRISVKKGKVQVLP